MFGLKNQTKARYGTNEPSNEVTNAREVDLDLKPT